MLKWFVYYTIFIFYEIILINKSYSFISYFSSSFCAYFEVGSINLLLEKIYKQILHLSSHNTIMKRDKRMCTRSKL